jgi:protein gp37
VSTQTSIEWTELTWNPTTGCSKVSPGCANCYAEAMSRRLMAMGMKGYENGFGVTLHPERLSDPLTRRRPSVFFVNSMSDLFHEAIPDSFVEAVLEIMRQAPWHTFQILTKRSERMATFFACHSAPPNAWLGVTVEDRLHGVPRVRHLRDVRCAVRFISMEPLLEDIGDVDLSGIDWVIIGGESGPRARRMKADWVVNVKRQCEECRVPFFFKQWGQWGDDGKKRSKRENGRLLLGRTWDEYPQPASSLIPA